MLRVRLMINADSGSAGWVDSADLSDPGWVDPVKTRRIADSEGWVYTLVVYRWGFDYICDVYNGYDRVFEGDPCGNIDSALSDTESRFLEYRRF